MLSPTHLRLLAAVAALGLALGGCDRPLSPHASRARAAARQAEAVLVQRAPDEARRIAALIAEAERVTAHELARPWWQRDGDRVGAAWDHAVAAGVRAVVASTHAEREAGGRWRELEPRVLAALATARREAAEPGVSRSTARLVQQAEVDLDRARRLAAQGAWDEAALAAESSLRRTAEVHQHWRELHDRFRDPEALALWQGWIADAAERTRRGGRALVVDKLRRELIVYERGRPVATYPVELGARGLLDKRHSGDRATPEGRYRVVERKERGSTRYYKALLIDYPNRDDRARFDRARKAGEIPAGTDIGGLIEIHGHGGRGRDWTDGCVALEDRLMDRVYALAPLGTPVVIVGTRAGGGGEEAR